MKKKLHIISFCLIIIVFLSATIILNKKYDVEAIQTSTTDGLSNKKIGWGIKRANNHEQPDIGKENQSLINKYEGYCLGNKDEKYIYITFDQGYEAGYTEKILDTLKENNVTATFFITAHYLNTNEDLVKRMIDEGHIVGNQFPYLLMDISKSQLNSRFAKMII